jgi:hypothetical protein
MMPKDKTKWHKSLHPHLNKPGDCWRCGTRYQSDPAKLDENTIVLCDTCKARSPVEDPEV